MAIEGGQEDSVGRWVHYLYIQLYLLVIVEKAKHQTKPHCDPPACTSDIDRLYSHYRGYSRVAWTTLTRHQVYGVQNSWPHSRPARCARCALSK